MIPLRALNRLLRNIVGEEYDEGMFRWQMKDETIQFNPSLDLQDVATLARIASGESWEWNK